MSIGNHTKLAAKAIAGTTSGVLYNFKMFFFLICAEFLLNSSLDMWLAQLLDICLWLFYSLNLVIFDYLWIEWHKATNNTE